MCVMKAAGTRKNKEEATEADDCTRVSAELFYLVRPARQFPAIMTQVLAL